jgi:hypothetical protein
VGQLLSAPYSVLGIIPKVRGDFSPSLVEGLETHTAEAAHPAECHGRYSMYFEIEQLITARL